MATRIRFAVSVSALFLLIGCASETAYPGLPPTQPGYAASTATPPPVNRPGTPVPPPESFHGVGVPRVPENFGYFQIGIGMAGLPGRDDIKPGTAITLTVPPGGIFVSALVLGTAAIVAGAGGDISMEGDIFIDAPLVGFNQGISTGGPDQISGFGLDAVLSWSTAEDLTFGGDVDTFGIGLGIRYIGGFSDAALFHVTAGLEFLNINFDNRPYAINVGPYLGFGLELMLAPQASFTTDIRYAFLSGDEPDYDYWEFTGGFVLYW